MTLADANDKRMPGSQAAREAGCTCDAATNGHGVGASWMGKEAHIVRLDCPLHGKRNGGSSDAK